MGFLSRGGDPEHEIDLALKHIRDLYGEILNIERKVASDVSIFFNYQHREDTLSKDISQLEKLKKEQKIKRGKEIMLREHKILIQEKNMLDDIRNRLRKVERLVRNQAQYINRIEQNL